MVGNKASEWENTRLAARLAATFADPLSSFADRMWAPQEQTPGSLTREALHQLVDIPAFSRPLRQWAMARAARRCMPHGRLNRESIGRLRQSAEGRLAVSVASAPFPTLERASLLLGATAMQRQILRTTAKKERQRLQSALGEAVHDCVVREAPIFDAGLADAGDDLRFRAIMEQPDDEAVRRGFVRFGLGLFVGFVDGCAPELGDMLSCRLPPEVESRGTKVDPRHVVRLVRRRMREWSASIA